ncbi:hypothetical protein Lepto7375DRAFT_7028 [Leptolyngbya sp. PCC 7375]|nr:hypothetical protein Lepto7375DRAFT_7028 [Leptolyngbya sp. PCC 7375]
MHRYGVVGNVSLQSYRNVPLDLARRVAINLPQAQLMILSDEGHISFIYPIMREQRLHEISEIKSAANTVIAAV